jgi:hypothetical protein
MQRFGLQRLAVVEPRRPHIARTIADQQLVNVFRAARRNVDALVVDLQFFTGLEIVVM